MSDSRRSKMASFVRSASLTICPWSVASFATQRFSSTNRPVSFSSTALICPAEAATRFMFSRPSPDPVCARGLCSCAAAANEQHSRIAAPASSPRRSPFAALDTAFLGSLFLLRNFFMPARFLCARFLGAGFLPDSSAFPRLSRVSRRITRRLHALRPLARSCACREGPRLLGSIAARPRRAVPFDRLAQPVLQFHPWTKAKLLLRASRVQYVPHRPVWIARVPQNPPRISRQPRNAARQLVNSHFPAAPQIDGFRPVVPLERLQNPFRAILDVQEIPRGRSRSPYRHFRRARFRRLHEFPYQCRDHAARSNIKIVPRPIRVRRNQENATKPV